jgi:hypothetical protein
MGLEINDRPGMRAGMHDIHGGFRSVAVEAGGGVRSE